MSNQNYQHKKKEKEKYYAYQLNNDCNTNYTKI